MASGIKVYVDLMSQPCRAISLFVQLCKIPHELVVVELRKGEHFEPAYQEKIHKFSRVPAVIDGTNNIIESIAIIRYLSNKFENTLYPKTLQSQALVDEFLEWHHINLRVPLSMYFQTKFLQPIIRGQPANQSLVNRWKVEMEKALDDVENIWLKSKPYIVGDNMSAADLWALCEIDQPRMAGYEPTEGRPRLRSWMEKIRKETQPYYDEVTTVVNKVIKKYGGVPPSDLSKL